MKDYLKSSLVPPDHQGGSREMLECSKSQVREYTAGSVIFGEEDRSRYLYLLLDGKVQIAKHLPSGSVICCFRSMNWKCLVNAFLWQEMNIAGMRRWQ